MDGVDLGLALAILIQAAGIIWWAATKNSEIDALKKSNADLAQECKSLAAKLTEHGELAARLDERSQAVLDLVRGKGG